MLRGSLQVCEDRFSSLGFQSFVFGLSEELKMAQLEGLMYLFLLPPFLVCAKKKMKKKQRIYALC